MPKGTPGAIPSWLAWFLASRLGVVLLTSLAALSLPSLAELEGKPPGSFRFLEVFVQPAFAGDERFAMGAPLWLLLVNQLALLGAYRELHRLEPAAVPYLAVFPGSLWLALPNTDGIFLWLALAATRLSREQRWGPALALGLLAWGLRGCGLALLVSLAVGRLWCVPGGPHGREGLQRRDRRNAQLAVYSLVLLLGWPHLRYLVLHFPLMLWLGRRPALYPWLYAAFSWWLGLTLVYFAKSLPL